MTRSREPVARELREQDAEGVRGTRGGRRKRMERVSIIGFRRTGRQTKPSGRRGACSRDLDGVLIIVTSGRVTIERRGLEMHRITRERVGEVGRELEPALEIEPRLSTDVGVGF